LLFKAEIGGSLLPDKTARVPLLSLTELFVAVIGAVVTLSSTTDLRIRRLSSTGLIMLLLGRVAPSSGGDGTLTSMCTFETNVSIDSFDVLDLALSFEYGRGGFASLEAEEIVINSRGLIWFKLRWWFFGD